MVAIHLTSSTQYRVEQSFRPTYSVKAIAPMTHDYYDTTKDSNDGDEDEEQEEEEEEETDDSSDIDEFSETQLCIPGEESDEEATSSDDDDDTELECISRVMDMPLDVLFEASQVNARQNVLTYVHLKTDLFSS
ncbi:hypothetical protein HWV62_15439 [Athelia sp. TMB]|nr:hypothetical protein HWV62_15439 [Athelia sp. TMB]